MRAPHLRCLILLLLAGCFNRQVLGDVDLAASTISLSQPVLSPGVSSTTVTVTVRNYGEPISGAAVLLTSDDPQARITQPAATTDMTGEATGVFTSQHAGVWQIRATVDVG